MNTENQGLELKREVDNFRDISKSSCALANAYGGKIVIGIDNHGKVFGVPEQELDILQQRLEGAVQQVSPVPFHKITVEDKEKKKVVVVEIYQIGHGSFCTFGGIVYYRAGSTDIKLEGRTLQDYLIKSHILSFDESLSSAKFEDVEPFQVQGYLKKRSPEVIFEEKNLREYLLNLQVAKQNGEFTLKNAGVLFFAKDPSKFLPQNEVKLVRFKGTKAVEIIDSRFVHSTILENLKEAEEFIRKNTRTAFKIEKLEREEIPEYPLKVMREALVNSFIHRDYFSQDAVQINIFDDRLEFLNPGTLPNGLSMQILGTLSIQRNPFLYRLMRELRLVEGLATGIPRMREIMAQNGLPEPKFEELGSFFRVTFYNNQHVEKAELNERQKRALSYLEKNPSINSKVYMKLTGISHPIAVAELNALCARNILRKIGKTRGSYYVLTERT